MTAVGVLIVKIALGSFKHLGAWSGGDDGANHCPRDVECVGEVEMGGAVHAGALGKRGMEGCLGL